MDMDATVVGMDMDEATVTKALREICATDVGDGMSFELMFDQGTLDVLSYHPATVLAEKLETVLRRGEANTRGRDFYDLYAIPRYYSGSISKHDLQEALRHTAGKRGSQQAIAAWKDTLEGIRASAIMRQVWSSYVADTSYASDVSLDDALDSIERLMGSLEL